MTIYVELSVLAHCLCRNSPFVLLADSAHYVLVAQCFILIGFRFVKAITIKLTRLVTCPLRMTVALRGQILSCVVCYTESHIHK